MLGTGKQIAVIGAVAMFATAAFGGRELQIDVNSLTTTVMGGGIGMTPDSFSVDPSVSDTFESTGATPRGGGFGLDFTGSISMAHDASSILAGVLIDGLSQSINGTLSAFSGQIDFVNGDVDGGQFTVTVLENDAVTMNTYTAQIMSGEGQINSQAGEPGQFSIDGLTFEGYFSSNLFAGVDVTDWNESEPLIGSFIEFKFAPNASGVDTDTDIDIFVIVPLPAGGALATVGLVGLAGVRRRRMA